MGTFDTNQNFISSVLQVTSIVSMPVWQLILNKIGKKSTYAAGMIVSREENNKYGACITVITER